MQTIQHNTQSTRGRKKGSKEVQIKPSSEWAFLPSCKNFLGFIINEGRHIKLHISGKKSEQRKKIYQGQKDNQDTYINVEEVVRKHFNYTISNPKKVIYFFRAPDQPNKGIDNIIIFLNKRWDQQQLNTQKEAMNLEQQVQYTQIVFPVLENIKVFSSLLSSPKQNQQRSFNNFDNEQNFNQLYSNELAQLQQQNNQEPKYQYQSYFLKSDHIYQQNQKQWYNEKSDHIQKQYTQKPSNDLQCQPVESAQFIHYITQESSNNLQLDFDESSQFIHFKPLIFKKESSFQDLDNNCLMFPIQNNDTNKLEITLQQNNSQQIEQQNTSRNPFLLDFIDPDLAKILEKTWHLFEEEFIFELILMFDARQKNMDTTNVLLNMVTENKNFSQILQNIFINKIINKEIQINEFRNEKLESFREKFQKLFESEEAKEDVENFFQSIYSIVKPDEDSEYQEYRGTPQIQNVSQGQGQGQGQGQRQEFEIDFEQRQEFECDFEQQGEFEQQWEFEYDFEQRWEFEQSQVFEWEEGQICECEQGQICECRCGATRKKVKI